MSIIRFFNRKRAIRRFISENGMSFPKQVAIIEKAAKTLPLTREGDYMFQRVLRSQGFSCWVQAR